jgi:hypothetical protein
MKRFAIVALTLLAALSAQAQIPAPDEYLGYRLGDRFTPHHRILGYFEELTRRSDLITLEQIGETYEHRPLMLATIASPRHRASLDAIRRNAAALVSGTADENALRDMPAIVWLAFGVHGNESSSAEAAMAVASTLVRDADARALLEDVVVIIDPLQNPDGRERYTEWFRRSASRVPDANPETFEHAEPWPGGRYNHYLIDMNRDWAWMSQKETQARVAAYRKWNPQVLVDFHEMSYQSNYFFPPDAHPINANLPRELERWLETFGRANAAEFSRRSWPFFVGERFDLFYPGYGDSWPSLRGAVGMTYEVAGGGRGGVAVRRADDTILTLADRVERHYTAGMVTVRTAAANREALLRYTQTAARAQMNAEARTFLIERGSPNFTALVDLLLAHGIEVSRLSAPVTLRAARVDRDGTESHMFPAGTAVVSTRQPLGGLVNTLLERAPAFTKGFVEQQRALAEADEPDEFYDLTTWSLPLAMNVEAWSTPGAVEAAGTWKGEEVPAFTRAAYGYLVDGLEANVYRFVGRLLERDLNFSVVDSEITVGEKRFPRGSIVILKGNNGAAVDGVLEEEAKRVPVAVVPLQSGWLGGTAFGSDKLRHVRDPKIALVGGPGSDPTSYGMLWHTFEVDTPLPHSRLNVESVRSVDLEKFEVLVFPDGNYADRLGKSGMEKIRQWVRDGGTLVAVKGAAAFLREKDIELSKLKPWEAAKKKDDESEETPEQRYNDYRIPGAAFRTSMNTRSFLTFGLPRPPHVLVEGSGALLPLAHRVDNVITIESKDPLVSGVAWPESIDRVKGSVYVAAEKAGRGQVITFADDPNFRLFWRGTLPVFLNAVLYAPSFPK